MGSPENKVTHPITDYLAYKKLYWFRNNVKQTHKRYNTNNPYFIDCGILDIGVLMPDGKTLYIETKTKTGGLSKSQEKFIKICIENNTPFIVVSDVSEVIAFIENHLKRIK